MKFPFSVRFMFYGYPRYYFADGFTFAYPETDCELSRAGRRRP